MALLEQSIAVFSRLRNELEILISRSKYAERLYSNFASAQLYYFGERCRSTSVLLTEGALWDCEILMRPAMECATRFIFVSIAESVERTIRIEEFSVSLCEIDDLQRSEKAKIAVSHNKPNSYENVFIGE